MGIIQKQSVQNTVISYAGIFLGYVNMVVLLPNYFDSSQVGLVRSMVYIAVFYAQFSALGASQILLKYFPYYNNREKEHSGFLSWNLILALIGFVLFTFVYYMSRHAIVGYFSQKSPLLIEYLDYIVPFAFATLSYNVLEAYLRSLKKTVVPSFIKDLLLRLLVAFSIALFAFGLIGFKGFVVLYIASNAAAVAIALVYLLYLKQLFLRPIWSFIKNTDLVAIIRYGIYSLFSNSAVLITMFIDALMLAAMMGLREVGIYTTSFFIASAITVPARSVFKISYPFIAEYWAKNDLESIRQLYKKVTLNNLVFGLIIFICIWINTHNIYGIMPNEYAQGILVILFIGFGRISELFSIINGIILTTSGKYKFDLFFSMALAILTIGTNYIFISKYGMNGAAFATFLSLSLISIARLVFVKAVFDIHPFTINMVWITLIGGLVVLANEAIPVIDNLFLDLFVRCSIAGLVYFTPIYFLNLSSDIKGMIDNILARIFPTKTPG